MGTDTVNSALPPLPPGFQLETSQAPTAIPPLPDGFRLEQNYPANVPLSSLTAPNPLGEHISEYHPTITDKIGEILGRAIPKGPLMGAGSDISNLLKPPTAIENMRPGVGKALGEQLTLPNIALLGTGGMIGELLKTPVGKAVFSIIAAKFAQKGAEEAGMEFGKASTEPAGGQRRYDITQGVLGAVQTIPVVSAPFYGEGVDISGLSEGDVQAPRLSDIGTPINRQLVERTATPATATQPQGGARFVTDPSGRTIDTSQLAEQEVREAMRGPRVYQAREEKVRPAQKAPVIVGGGLNPERPPIYNPNQPPIFAPIIESAYQSSGEPKQGGQVSFEGQAGAKAVPSARQAGTDVSGSILPAVRAGKGTFIAKPEQITHADILKANGINPKAIPHNSPRRGFVDTRAGKWLTRKEAEQVTGIKGTAPAGGLDSTDLPRAGSVRKEMEERQQVQPIRVQPQPQPSPPPTPQKFERQVYSPEDLESYKRLRQGTIPQSAAQISSPEFQENWRQFEQLRNKYGGMPPKQEQERESESQNATRTIQQQESGEPQHQGNAERGPSAQEGGSSGVGNAEKEHGGTSQNKPVAQESNASQQKGVQQGTQQGDDELRAGSGNGGVLGQGGEKLHSGVPLPSKEDVEYAGRLFVTGAEKLLRNSKELGFAQGTQVDAQQLKNRLKNKLGEGSTEWRILQDAGVEKFLEGGKRTPKEVADWVKENGPKVEVRKFGKDVISPQLKAYNEMSHTWLDSLTPANRGKVESAILDESGYPVLDTLEQTAKARQYIDLRNKVRDSGEKVKEKLPSTRPLGWNPTWDLSAKEREQQILENPDAVKLEDSSQFRSQPGEKGNVIQTASNKITAAVNTLARVDKVVLPRDVVLDMVDGGNGSYTGPISRLFGWTIDDAYNREEVLFGRIVDKLKPLQKGFTKQNRERVGVYAIAQQAGGVQRLLDSGVKQGTIDHILKTFTPKEKAWYDQYRKISEEMFPYVQRLAKELYNINLRYVENHFPFMRDYQLVAPELPEMVKPGEEGATPEDIVSMRELMADYAVAEKGTKTQQGFLITRQPNAKTAIQYDAVAVAHRFLRDVSHFITTQKLLKENGEIARSPKFREKYGQYGQQLIVDWMNTVARQGRFKRQSQILQWLRRKSSVGILAFRIASNLVHTANIPMAVDRSGGVGNWRRGLDAALSDEGQAFLNKHFKETFSRGGGEPALVEATRGPITRAGFAVERVIDRLNSQATSLGVYMKLLAEKGLNPEEYDTLPVDKDAIAKARVLSRRAVASPLYKDTPAVLARGSDWTKLFFQFQNTFLDQWSNIRYDLAETRIGEFVKAAAKGEIDRATAHKIATLTAAVTAMIFWETSIRYGVKEVEDRLTGHGPQQAGDFWKRLGEDALKRVPGVGQTLAVAQYGESGFPLVDTIRDTAKAGQAAYQAAESGEPHKEKEALVKTATGIGEILGVPGTSQASELLQDYMTSSPGLADRSQMYQQARKWMRASGVRVEAPSLESQYIDLNDTLRKGDMESAQAAYQELKGKVKAENIKKYYEEFPERGFTNNKDNEAKFYASLTPEQRVVYDRAKAANEEVQKRFFEMVGEKVPERKKEERTIKPRKKLSLFK